MKRPNKPLEPTTPAPHPVMSLANRFTHLAVGYGLSDIICLGAGKVCKRHALIRLGVGAQLRRSALAFTTSC
jgi:hypothetical protein